MSRLVLGPLLRHVRATDATVWVELDGPAEVEVLGCRARTFIVESHWFALVLVSGPVPGRDYSYEVPVDGVPFDPNFARAFRQSLAQARPRVKAAASLLIMPAAAWYP
ncbi:MAG: hypothetical protein ABR569_11285 [Gaiellaceae bacterium]